MSCFQPQLAQFQAHSFEKVVSKLGVTDEDREFWIEEKLDGERMQLHMIEDDEVPGGKRFAFWSRKSKDYTYLYGHGFEDNTSALTRHIKDAFHPGVRNIILDGEMITWDPEADIMVPFGTLKTAAISEQRDPYAGTGPRPLFRVFDCVYLNDKDLTKYPLRDRRNALEKAVQNVHRRIELHDYTVTDKAADIEPRLREVVAGGREGLVLKNPRSVYRLNSRVDDWMKVKPEYMAEFGENLDCLIIGGFYGSGHRGGRLSSFMCGLRVDKNHIAAGQRSLYLHLRFNTDRPIGANPMKFFSFFKVGGGLQLKTTQISKKRQTENG
jgi:DNA ligase-4